MPDDDNDDIRAGMANDNQLDADDDTPFAPPTSDSDLQFMNHQKADTDIDETELYNEGWAGAAGEEPRSDSGVVSYTPPPKDDADDDDKNTDQEDS